MGNFFVVALCSIFSCFGLIVFLKFTFDSFLLCVSWFWFLFFWSLTFLSAFPQITGDPYLAFTFWSRVLKVGRSMHWIRLVNQWASLYYWRQKWQPTPLFLPGEFHGQNSLMGYSPWSHKELDTTEWLTHTSLYYRAGKQWGITFCEGES